MYITRNNCKLLSNLPLLICRFEAVEIISLKRLIMLQEPYKDYYMLGFGFKFNSPITHIQHYAESAI